MCFLLGEHALGQLGATRETVGKIERFGNHDARIAVDPIRRRIALKSYTEAKFESGEIARRSALIVGIANRKNLARQDTGFRNRTRIGRRGFGFKDGENDGVAFDEDFLCVEAVEKLLYGFVQIQAEM